MVKYVQVYYLVMVFKFECGVMKVGNSHVMVLPKSLRENYGIKEQDKLQVLATESGLFIPLKPKKELSDEIQQMIKESKQK